MNLFSFNKVTKGLSGRILFENLTLGMNEGEKIALVGTNGTGKSTFLNLLTGNLIPDSGSIHLNRQTRISYLNQQADFESKDSVFDFVLKDDNPAFRLLHDFYGCSENPDKPGCSEIFDRMDRENGWGMESRIRTVLHEMGIKDGNVRMSLLSGGMRRRAALARTLLGDSNLLVLDEPTNHLDIPTILKLQKILEKTDQAVLLVTHDRYLADAVCGKIWELDDQTVYPHDGGYSCFLTRRAERIEAKQNRQVKIANILRTELDWLSRGPKARGGKDKKRKERIYGLLEEQKNESVGEIKFDTIEGRRIKRILEMENVSVSFDGNKIIDDFSMEFLPGQRIGILGPNGAGKTTLLNLIAGEVQAMGGETHGNIDMGVNTKTGYFRQLTPKMKDLGVIEFLKETAPILSLANGSTYTPSQLLDWFQFPRSLHYQPISTLSGGEKRRLFLVDTLLHNPNFLMLDEPTNDFDLQTLSALENFLEGFSGCLLVVSHDRYFLDRTVDFLLTLDGDGMVSGFPGKCTEYLEYLEEKEKSEKSEKLKKEKTKNRDDNSNRNSSEEKPKKLSFKEKKEFEEIEVEIEKLEDEKSELEKTFSSANPNPEVIMKGTVRFNEIQEKLETLMVRWEELGERAGV